MSALLDTGVLLAALAENDDLHEVCVQVLEQESDVLLPDIVLPELAYLLIRDAGYPPMIEFLNALAAGEMPFARFTIDDLKRAGEIMGQYADSGIDFVDCVIVAMAERLDVTRILTLDRRHFTIVRPKHCASFEILP